MLARAALVLLLVVAPPAAVGEAPRRVVSMNLCTDQLAILLAAPGQLVSVSHVAHDPVSSALAREAAAYPANRAQAEEIFLLGPDLVLAGAYDNPATLAMLETLGLRVERFPVEATFDDIRANMRRMGALLGAEAAAEAMVAEMDAALDAAPATGGDRPLAALQYSNSYTSGAGTLADAVLAAAGLANLAAEEGITGMARLPLETLVLARPDLIVTGQDYAAPALAQEVLRHPAARGLARAGRVAVSDALWTCGTPLIAEAVARLRATQ
jgi:iron complex transport system substrate-binding protein